MKLFTLQTGVSNSHFLQAKALTEQRQEVKLKDLLVLEHTLWENVDQKMKVSEIVQNHALDIVSKTKMEIPRIIRKQKVNQRTKVTTRITMKLEQRSLTTQVFFIVC
ncbi:hypothetical protein [Gracilibacillus alcaliphilus]|uniref:hypothetical protein n=1 Tax=Gracilibacillus alcaliphilus TaxID=1401441 RepID=UPI001958DD7A